MSQMKHFDTPPGVVIKTKNYGLLRMMSWVVFINRGQKEKLSDTEIY